MLANNNYHLFSLSNIHVHDAIFLSQTCWLSEHISFDFLC
nr:MAG TPA_asm: hypothetical protein [Bacteriophage sp.]